MAEIRSINSSTTSSRRRKIALLALWIDRANENPQDDQASASISLNNFQMHPLGSARLVAGAGRFRSERRLAAPSATTLPFIEDTQTRQQNGTPLRDLAIFRSVQKIRKQPHATEDPQPPAPALTETVSITAVSSGRVVDRPHLRGEGFPVDVRFLLVVTRRRADATAEVHTDGLRAETGMVPKRSFRRVRMPGRRGPSWKKRLTRLEQFRICS